MTINISWENILLQKPRCQQLRQKQNSALYCTESQSNEISCTEHLKLAYYYFVILIKRAGINQGIVYSGEPRVR